MGIVVVDPPRAARRLRILCLHGYEQDSAIFQTRLRRHMEALKDTADFVFVDAPNTLRPYDVDGMDNVARAADARAGRSLGRTLRGWYWPRSLDPEDVCGLEASIAHLESVLEQQGPFDGVFGFSQGKYPPPAVCPTRRGLMAAVLCARLERQQQTPGGRATHPPFRFAVIASGYKLKDAKWAHVYETPIGTQSLHLYGVLDSMIHISQSMELQGAFARPVGLSFLGDHFVPKSHEAVRAVQQFVEQFA
ncbi:Ovarian cancer-associated protein 2 [Coemansia nantahalensis]|uniref:Ovarian cancer-associated protein 2 n=1 Tax=Coemansia nantahalensis TaxID=2789366 RepID=A0ACC1JNB7_9FUNG|nr:Ovarian cancer-associated protein 2 [Coemansia nantahalensis]